MILSSLNDAVPLSSQIDDMHWLKSILSSCAHMHLFFEVWWSKWLTHTWHTLHFTILCTFTVLYS